MEDWPLGCSSGRSAPHDGYSSPPRPVTFAVARRPASRRLDRPPVCGSTRPRQPAPCACSVDERPERTDLAPAQLQNRSPRVPTSLPCISRNATGMQPLNWLLPSRSDSRLVRLPSSAGIGPLNWLPPRNRNPRLARPPSSAGIGPLCFAPWTSAPWTIDLRAMPSSCLERRAPMTHRRDRGPRRRERRSHSHQRPRRPAPLRRHRWRARCRRPLLTSLESRAARWRRSRTGQVSVQLRCNMQRRGADPR